MNPSFVRNQIHFRPNPDKKHNRLFIGVHTQAFSQRSLDLSAAQPQKPNQQIRLPTLNTSPHKRHHPDQVLYINRHATVDISPKNLNRHQRSLSSYQVTDFQPSKIRKSGNSQGKVKLHKYLSSKVDFFNEENERRLRLKKRKVLMDKGVIRSEKQKIQYQRESEVAPSMVLLLKDYLQKRSQSEIKNQEYYVLGKEF